MPGSCTITEVSHSSVKSIKWAWTSDASGDGSGSSFTTTFAYSGKILALATDPGATAPTDNYDIVINDADGFDVLHGTGANRDTANTEYVAQGSLGAAGGSTTLALVVSNAGNAKEGVVKLWVR